MSKSKSFQVLVFVYMIFLCILIGLIIHKLTFFQNTTTTPSVSFNIEVTEQMSPEKLVSEIYGWMNLDSQRSKSILANTLPHLDQRAGNKGILQQVVEPKNIIEQFVCWVAGIHLGEPSTYMVNTYPRIDSSTMVMAPARNGSFGTADQTPVSASPNQLIVAENSRIQLNIPPEEMLSHATGRQIGFAEEEPRVVPDPVETQTVERQEPALKPRTPRILIYHAHTSETYNDDPNPRDNTFHAYLPNLGRITWVGREVARVLKEKGFEVYHDTTSYDGKVFGEAYTNVLTGNVSQLIAKQHFDLVLDIHRDGPEADIRNNCLINIDGKNAAKVMFVVARGNVDYVSDARQKTLRSLFDQKLVMAGEFARKMQEIYPGLLRDVRKAEGKWYAQQLHPHSMIVEVGYQKNKTAEALYSAELIADVIYKLFTDDPSLLLD